MNGNLSLNSLAERVTLLEMEKDLMLGRLNGLHQLVLVLLMEREGPTEDVVSHLKLAIERLAADALATPLAESTITEMLRVNREALDIATHLVQGRGTPRWRDGNPA